MQNNAEGITADAERKGLADTLIRRYGGIGISDGFGRCCYNGVFPCCYRTGKESAEIKHAGMAKPADVPDLGSVITVELFHYQKIQLDFLRSLKYHIFWVMLLRCFFSATFRQVNDL